MPWMRIGSPSPPPHLQVVFENNKHWWEICLHQHSTGICYFPKLWSLTKCLSRHMGGRAGTITLKEIDFRAHLLLAVKWSYTNFKADTPVTTNLFRGKTPKEIISFLEWLPETELNCWDHYMLLLLMEGRNMHIMTCRTSLLKSSANASSSKVLIYVRERQK